MIGGRKCSTIFMQIGKHFHLHVKHTPKRHVQTMKVLYRMQKIQKKQNKTRRERRKSLMLQKRSLKKRQAEREGGHILILPSEVTEEAGGLSSRTLGLSYEGKDTEYSLM